MVQKAIPKTGDKKPAFADHNGLSMDKNIALFFNEETVTEKKHQVPIETALLEVNLRHTI